MIRNILGSLLALAGATAAALSPFRAWYDGRHGSGIRVDDLFRHVGVTTRTRPCSAPSSCRWASPRCSPFWAYSGGRGWWSALAGCLVLGVTVLWMVRQAQFSHSLTAGGDGLGTGVGRRSRAGCCSSRGPSCSPGGAAPAGEPEVPLPDGPPPDPPELPEVPAPDGAFVSDAAGDRAGRRGRGCPPSWSCAGPPEPPGPPRCSLAPRLPELRPLPGRSSRTRRRRRREPDPEESPPDEAARDRAASAPQRAAPKVPTRPGGSGPPRGRPRALRRVQRVHAAVLASTRTPRRRAATGEPVISPPVSSRQRSWPPCASTVYRQWSLEPKCTRPSATAGDPTISPCAANRHFGAPADGVQRVQRAARAEVDAARGDHHRLHRLPRLGGDPPAVPAGRRVERVHRAEVVGDVDPAAGRAGAGRRARGARTSPRAPRSATARAPVRGVERQDPGARGQMDARRPRRPAG